MRDIPLERYETGDDGTFGKLQLGTLVFNTGELPWRDNKQGESCVPEGSYLCEWIHSPKHGMCYELKDVLGRSDIQIHSANLMGDKSKGKLCELLGCIALGNSVGRMGHQKAILQSKDAINQFHNIMKGEPFMLHISWKGGEEDGTSN